MLPDINIAPVCVGFLRTSYTFQGGSSGAWGGGLGAFKPGGAFGGGGSSAAAPAGVDGEEPTSGGSQAANEPNTKVIEDGGAETRTLRKIWGVADGIG